MAEIIVVLKWDLSVRLCCNFTATFSYVGLVMEWGESLAQPSKQDKVRGERKVQEQL